MKIAITGGAGFVGSSLGIHLKTTHPNYEIIAFENLRRRGSEFNISRLKEHQITFIHGDIRNPEDLNDIGDCLILGKTENTAKAILKLKRWVHDTRSF
jgi:CDP-paratose 2-epimerase